jgi:hypothetical protein
VWSHYYLGSSISEAGLITGDFNADGEPEIFLGMDEGTLKTPIP